MRVVVSYWAAIYHWKALELCLSHKGNPCIVLLLENFQYIQPPYTTELLERKGAARELFISCWVFSEKE